MPLLLAVMLSLLAGCSLHQPSSAAPRATATAFISVTVMDASGEPARPDQTVVVVGDRIQAVGHTAEVQIPTDARLIDAAGMYMIPGLWDSHVHLSFAAGEAEVLLPVFLANGVTSLRDTGGHMDLAALRDRVANGELPGPRIRMAGPLVESADWLRAAREVFSAMAEEITRVFELTPRVPLGTPEQAGPLADSLASLGVDFIKVRNVHGATYTALAEAAERLGIPLAAHTPRRVSLAEAVAAGTDSFEHTETITFALGDLEDAARRAAVAPLRRAGTFVVPTVVTALTYRGSPAAQMAHAVVVDTLNQVDARRRYLPPMILRGWRGALEAAEHEPPMDWEAHLRREMSDLRLLHEEGVRFLAGSDFGGVPMIFPGFSLHEELQLLVARAGMTPLQALQTATRNPPIFFGMQSDLGTVEAGKIADLILLRADPLANIGNTQQIEVVVAGGRVFDRAALDALLRNAAEAVERATRAPPE